MANETAFTPSAAPFLDGSTEAEDLEADSSLPLAPYIVAVGCVGILNNSFVVAVVVFHTTMTKKTTGCLILNQSCIDMVASVMTVGRQVIFSKYGGRLLFGGRGFMAELYCRFWLTGACSWCFLLASTTNLVVITIERYVSVVFPLHHKNSCTRRAIMPVLVASSWVIGVVFEFGWCAGSSYVFERECYLFTFYGNQKASSVYGILSVVLYYCVPVGCMLLCYPHMIWALSKRNPILVVGVGQPSQLNSRKSTSQRNLLKTMVIVAVCYVLCWTWFETTWLFYNLGTVTDEMMEVIDYANILAIVNLIINPFIYIFNYRQFRVGLKRMWKSWGGQVVPQDASSLTTARLDVSHNGASLNNTSIETR